MGDSQAAVGFDRLPWLADEPQPRARRSGRDVAAWAVAATLLVAGASYWMGANSVHEPPGTFGEPAPTPKTTVTLPEPRPAQSIQAQVPPEVAPQVEPLVAPPIPVTEETATARPSRAPSRAPLTRTRAKPERSAKPRKSTPRATKPVAKADAMPLWPSRVVEGASGRMVRIGTFATVRQAKKGWWGVVRVYPGMKRLPTVVVPVQSLRNGQVYYRLQMGTTSQAHSEVLCQRMRMIAQSCVVIGLPASSGRALR